MSIDLMRLYLLDMGVIHNSEKFTDNQIIAIYNKELNKPSKKQDNDNKYEHEEEVVQYKKKPTKDKFSDYSFIKDGVEYESEDAYYDAIDESIKNITGEKIKHKFLKLKESLDINEFKDRFGSNYKHFYNAYELLAKLKFGEDWENHIYDFIRMFDLTDSKLGKVYDCFYNKEKNKIIMYDQYNKPIAICNCKDGWSADKVKSKFDLTEDINEEKQYNISFPLIVIYQCNNKNVDKEDIENYQYYELKCIEKYAKQALINLLDNNKFICETLDTFDADFEYDGYDDNFHFYLILKVKSDDLADETIIKAIKRYINFESDFSTLTDDGDLLLTALPVVVSTTNFIIEKI